MAGKCRGNVGLDCDDCSLAESTAFGARVYSIDKLFKKNNCYFQHTP